ncbi:hypothetical protein CS369_08630 [Candidatus Symbiopectobacterium sp. 'North America']|uniref:leucine-rich repeat domain-containing protein n=1 Tax=Candidatus Symbiopectobacterium sp. 'North America' TaxID=2794574 RepID=UPI0018CA8E00|nr:leucine-rich repeat domain-containing protein [Candidatus Symbiopectobacterium sp. 'North America']MBG6244810.1 hypothetical protein [Candidatus Symbiopectobacterium sp. 'North America']
MMPINNSNQPHFTLPNDTPTVAQTFQSGSTSQTTTIFHDHSEYHTVWSSWKEGTPVGGGEKRDIAVERMHCALAMKSAFLDLSGLNLSSLPDLIPEQLEELYLDKNQIHVLPENMPEDLN